jgi:hypothetical protein
MSRVCATGKKIIVNPRKRAKNGGKNIRQPAALQPSRMLHPTNKARPKPAVPKSPQRTVPFESLEFKGFAAKA